MKIEITEEQAKGILDLLLSSTFKGSSAKEVAALIDIFTV